MQHRHFSSVLMIGGLLICTCFGPRIAAANAPLPQNEEATKFTVDVNVLYERHPISPLIYGVAIGKPDQVLLLNVPVNRSRGNANTRDNPKLNATISGNDWYFMNPPEIGNFGGEDVSESTQILRNRSTRVLWDPHYKDKSKIATQDKLIPRMKESVRTKHPGTKIGITEYNWGAEKHISGALAQADVLGILGREGFDLATRRT